MQKLRIIIFKAVFLLVISFHEAGALSLNELINTLEEQIAQQKQFESVIVKIENSNFPNHLSKNNDVDFKLISWSYKQNINNKIDVVIENSGAVYNIIGHYEAGVLAPILKQKLQRGSVISIDVLEMEKVPVSLMESGLYATSLQEIEGKYAKKLLINEKPIRLSDIEDPVAIEKGANVTLRFKKKNLTIETLGVSMEPGYIGKAIRVRNLDTNKIIKGVVQDSNTVAIHMR